MHCHKPLLICAQYLIDITVLRIILGLLDLAIPSGNVQLMAAHGQ